MKLRTISQANSENNNVLSNTEKALKELEKLKAESKTETKTKNQKDNIHSGHRSRLKTQFLENGLSSLTDIQKLELLLFYSVPQKDTNPIAHELINHFGSLKNALQADYNDLMKISGIKENSALLINLVNAFTNISHMPDSGEIISCTQSAIEYVSKFFCGINVEQFYVICLSKEGKVIKTVMINSGTSDEVSVQIRTITQIAIENKTNRIIVCHNHPNGPAKTSDEDCRFTYSLICSCLLNSIDVLDHIIVGTNKTISMHEQGTMEKLKKRATNTIQLSRDKELFLSASSSEYKISKNDN